MEEREKQIEYILSEIRRELVFVTLPRSGDPEDITVTLDYPTVQVKFKVEKKDEG